MLAIVAVWAVAGCLFDPSGTGASDAAASANSDGGGSSGDGGAGEPALAVGDVRLVFATGSNDLATARLSGTTWTDELSIPIGTASDWLEARVSAAGEELVGAIAADDLHLSSLASTRWQMDWLASNASAAPQDERRSFDAVIESSGDALVVYVARGELAPRFRAREAGQWTDEAIVPTGAGADCEAAWIELVGGSSTDSAALLYADVCGDLYAVVWDGSTWLAGSYNELTTQLAVGVGGAMTTRPFHAQFESQSGDLLAVWVLEGANDFVFSTWSTEAQQWSAPGNRAVYVGESAHVALAADPSSDRIAAAFIDRDGGTKQLGLGLWTGDDWTALITAGPVRDDVDQGAYDHMGSVAWLPDTGSAVCVYPGTTSGTLDWARLDTQGTPTWTVQTGVAIADFGAMQSVRLVTLVPGDRALAVLSDDAGALVSAITDGSNWSLVTQHTTALPAPAHQFSVAVRAP